MHPPRYWAQAVISYRQPDTGVWEILPFPCIHPKSTFNVSRTVTLVYFILASLWIIPFQLAFDYALDVGFNEPSTTNLQKMWMIVLPLIDLFFASDIIFNFATAFEDDGELIVDLRNIGTRYVRSWFCIDFISSASGLFVVVSELGNFRTLSSLRIFRFLRLVKVMNIFKLSNNETSKQFEPYLAREDCALVLKLCKIFAYSLGVTHLIACAVYSVCDPNEENWMHMYYEGRLSAEIESYEQLPVVQRYMTSFYWACVVITTVGFGDISPVTDAERMLVSFCVFVGSAVCALIFAELTALATKKQARDLAYQEKQKQVEDFMRYYSFPKKVRKLIRKYYQQHWERCIYFDSKVIVGELSFELRHIVGQFLQRDVVHKLPFFRVGSPAEGCEGAIQMLVSFLTQKHCTAGMILWRFEDLDTKPNTYIVDKGEVHVHIHTDDIRNGTSSDERSDDRGNEKKNDAKIRSTLYLGLGLEAGDWVQVVKEGMTGKTAVVLDPCTELQDELSPLPESKAAATSPSPRWRHKSVHMQIKVQMDDDRSMRTFMRQELRPISHDDDDYVMQEGSFFGLLSDDTHNATITALTNCELLVLSRAHLFKVMERFPPFRLSVAELFSCKNPYQCSAHALQAFENSAGVKSVRARQRQQRQASTSGAYGGSPSQRSRRFSLPVLGNKLKKIGAKSQHSACKARPKHTNNTSSIIQRTLKHRASRRGLLDVLSNTEGRREKNEQQGASPSPGCHDNYVHVDDHDHVEVVRSRRRRSAQRLENLRQDAGTRTSTGRAELVVIEQPTDTSAIAETSAVSAKQDTTSESSDPTTAFMSQKVKIHCDGDAEEEVAEGTATIVNQQVDTATKISLVAKRTLPLHSVLSPCRKIELLR